MTKSESSILAFFRRFDVGPEEMLFFNTAYSKTHDNDFKSAMRSLIRKGMVMKDRPAHAYSLTMTGYRASLVTERAAAAAAAPAATGRTAGRRPAVEA